MEDNFLLKQFLIAIVLFILFSNGVDLILTFFKKKNTFITKVKADFCEAIQTKYRRIGAVTIIFIIAIVFNIFYNSAPVSAGVITGSLCGIVIFFKENDKEQTFSE